MDIRFYHTKAYDWETIKPEEAKKGDVLGTNAKGEATRRITIDSPYTDIHFAGGAIDTIHEDRAAAGLGKKADISIIVQHLQDGVIPHHFDMADVTDITTNDEELTRRLRAYFGVGK